MRARFACAGDALAADASTLRAAGLTARGANSLVSPDWTGVDAAMTWAHGPGHAILTPDSPGWPPLLRTLADAPALLYVQGDADLIAMPQLAVVGSRNPTTGGCENARAFAGALARAGLVITSGLALGIDAAAHQGALGVGGATVAVLGTGIDVLYPASNRALAQRIAAEGALVSELPLGTPPRRVNFPGRNRVISALSLGVLVVEAAERSGSLITARLAAEQGREVFALPGSIHNPMARGCHSLIRNGAVLTESLNDILTEIGPMIGMHTGSEDARDAGTGAQGGPAQAGLDPDYGRLFDALEFDPVGVDLLVQRTGLTADAVSSMLLILELRGLVYSHSGGLYTRAAREDPT